MTQSYKKLAAAFSKFCENGTAPEDVKSMLQYCEAVFSDLEEYNRVRENTILFGKSVEMNDLRQNEASLGMRLVPVTRDEFKLHVNPKFLQFASLLGIQRQSKG